MKLASALVIVLTAVAFAPTSRAQCSQWDPRFGPAASGGQGTNGYVRALQVFDDGSGTALYAGGAFSTAGGVSAPGIARWNGTSWSALGSPGSGANFAVDALAVFDAGDGPALYAGGDFTGIGGIPASRIARWNGTSWSALAGGTVGQVTCLKVHDDGSGPALYVGGQFTTATGVAASRIARWNGTSWSALGSGMNAAVLALESHDDGSGPALFAAGIFQTAGGVSVGSIAKWDGAGWSALGAPGAIGGPILALKSADLGSGPVLLAAGGFTWGVPGFVKAWDGASWTTLPDPSGLGGEVHALAVYDGGHGPHLYAGGDFSPNGASLPDAARFDGAAWTSIGAPGVGISGIVYTFAAYDGGGDGDADLYLGGDLGGWSGGIAFANDFALWHGCANDPATPTPYCFGDGSLAACPCGNTGVSGRGCENSAATGGALLAASGATFDDSLVLTQSAMLPAALAIFAQGDATLPGPLPFGDGLRCVGGALKRLYTKTSAGGTASVPQAGDLTISQRSAELGDPLAPGDVRSYYAYYRDADPGFCPSPAGNTFNVGNALRVVW